jgi:hypothetical protein
MLTYRTTLPSTIPVPDQDRAEALRGLTVKSPYKYGINHQDILNSLGSENAIAYDINASKANADYQLRQQDAERQLVLQGLQQMGQAKQNSTDLVNSRLQSMYGTVGNLLSGLFN